MVDVPTLAALVDRAELEAAAFAIILPTLSRVDRRHRLAAAILRRLQAHEPPLDRPQREPVHPV